MKKILLLLSIVFVLTIGVNAQNIPDCDTGKLSFTSYPCKVTVKNGGKEYWNVIKQPYYFTANTSTTLNNFSFATLKPAHYRWVAFYRPGMKSWHIDNPDSTAGKYVMHIKKRQLKWLNDSTAVYTPETLTSK